MTSSTNRRSKDNKRELAAKKRALAKARRDAAREKAKNERRAGLRRLIIEIREEAISRNKQGKKLTENTINRFAQLLVERTTSTYRYKDETYPDFAIPDKLGVSRKDYPATLAEMFIWKQTDWPKYLKFRDWYNPKLAMAAPQGGAVHYAFAKYLAKKGKEPIFDQHSCRAIWALLKPLPGFDDSLYKSYLTHKGSWNSGQNEDDVPVDCYWQYLEDAARFTSPANYDALNKLLMPLGRAVRAYSSPGRDFANFVTVRKGGK
jgi:hypothetical protein